MKESDFRLLESVLAAKTWKNSRIFSSIALKKLMNIRFTISKVSRNDHLKLSQSRNVSLTPELFPGNKSNTTRLPLVFAKIFSIPPPYEQIPVIVGLVVFPRTATSQGENHHANWAARNGSTKEDIYRKEEKLKELFVPRTSRRKKSERSENPFWNDNGWSIPIVTELGNYRSAPANNAANCQSPRVQRSMISRRSLKVAGFEECETVKKFCTCETPVSSNSSIRCKGFS